MGIGGRIDQVQATFAPRYGFDVPALTENAFDLYFKDEEEFKLGNYTCRVIHLPGHTPDHIGYVCGSAIFTGDSIFNVSTLLRSFRRVGNQGSFTPSPLLFFN